MRCSCDSGRDLNKHVQTEFALQHSCVAGVGNLQHNYIGLIAEQCQVQHTLAPAATPLSAASSPAGVSVKL